jgi:hypothetical protein
MPETTGATPPRATIGRCCVCDTGLIGGTAVAMIERMSGAPRTLHACSPCIARYGIVPLDEQEHPAGDGRLVYRGRQRRSRPGQPAPTAAPRPGCGE